MWQRASSATCGVLRPLPNSTGKSVGVVSVAALPPFGLMMGLQSDAASGKGGYLPHADLFPFINGAVYLLFTIFCMLLLMKSRPLRTPVI